MLNLTPAEYVFEGGKSLTSEFLSPGVFLRRLGVCAGDRRHPMAEGGWEEVVEEALLPPQGFGNLLRPQRQS